MEAIITEIEPCKFLASCTANANDIKEKRAVVFESFKKMPVKGFRANKADSIAINATYGKQIDEALKRALMEELYHFAIFEHKLKVHGAPKFNTMLMDNGKFTCEFETLTRPDFTMPDWKAFEIPTPHSTVNGVNLAEQMLQELRVRCGDVLPYIEGDFVQNGDNVILDYDGTVDGQKVDSLSVQGEMITIGKMPLKGFDENLLGMQLGETREFDFIAPADGFPSLSGKTIHFTATLNMGSKTVPCALDDELAKKVGQADYPALQKLVAEMAFAKSAEAARSVKQEAVARRLVAETTIAVPNWMSLSEAQYIAQQSQLKWETMPDGDKEKMIEIAEQNTKLALILDKVRDDEPEAQLSEQEIFNIIKQNLLNTKTGKNPDEVLQEMNKTGYLQVLQQRIKDEYALEHCIKTVKFVD